MPSITNGETAETPRGTTYNEIAILSCVDGYTLNGNAFVTCQADGNWTTLPSCDIKSKDNDSSSSIIMMSLNHTNQYKFEMWLTKLFTLGCHSLRINLLVLMYHLSRNVLQMNESISSSCVRSPEGRLLQQYYSMQSLLLFIP